MQKRSKRRNIILLVVVLLVFASIAQAQSLDRGHRILLERGLQLNAMVAVTTTGYFDTARWAESNFTTIDFIGGHYPTALMPPPPGVPWANIAQNNTVAPFINVNLEAYRRSLVRVSLSDERDITDSNVLAWDKACTEIMHDRLPNVIVHSNQGGIPSPAAILNYMQHVQPDMLMFDHYPFDNPHLPGGKTVGGSPTLLYEHLEQYRKYGLQGLDGTGTRPIPTGMYTQTFSYGKYRISESEIRLNNFSAWAFGCKLINSFTYDKRNDSIPAVMFTGYGTARPTLQFYYVAETNRQSLNLGPALVRLISTDLRMKMGRHPQVTGGPSFASTVQAAVVYSQDFEGLNTGLLTGQDSWVDGGSGTSTTVIAVAGGLMDPASTQALSGPLGGNYFEYFSNKRALPGTYTAANTDWISLSFEANGEQEFKMLIGSDATGYFGIEVNGPSPFMVADGPNGWMKVTASTAVAGSRMKVLIDFTNNKVNAFYDADAADIQAGVYDGNDVDGAVNYSYGGNMVGSDSNMINNGTFNVAGSPVNFGAADGLTVDTIKLYLKMRNGDPPLGYLDNILVEIVPATLALNTKPDNVSSWDSAADPYITNITATNLGSKNGGFRGDVIVGYFKPLAPEFTNPGHEDDIYFMVLNGLSAASATAAETRQSIILDFDFGDSGINSLLRLNRSTGKVDEVSLIHNGGSSYRLEMFLPGGTGDLFKFNNGGRFVGEFLRGDANLD